MQEKTHYEARLNKDIGSHKKGTLIRQFKKEDFEVMTNRNVNDYFIPEIITGHGTSQYFDLKNDIDFIRVTIYTKKEENIVNLKD